MDAMTTNYMLGHVLINGNSNPREWSIEELVIAFSTLPRPKVSLDQFKANFGGEDEPQEMTEEEKLASNSAQFKKLGR
jgi:hypothetical protein